MDKILHKNDPENVLVYVSFINDKKEKCECVGVLMEERKNRIRVAFNAIDDIAKDKLYISTKNILNLSVIDDKKIKVLR